MAKELESRTGSTLLVLLRDLSDPVSWEGFVARYGPKIYNWCRQWGLQESDAQDVTQNVLLKLVKRLRAFVYDPAKGTFRGWLKTVTRHAWSDYLESERRGGIAAGGSAALECLHGLEAQTGLLQALEGTFDLELLSQALAQVRLEVSARDWDLFHLLTVGGRSTAEVGQQFQMKPAAVLMAKSRVKTKLCTAIRELECDGQDNPQGQP